MSSTFFHIDVNSAFLSWTAIEQLKNGQEIDLRTIPSIIGGDSNTRHGIVLAKSIPAKKYGITTAEPIISAMKKCPKLVIAKPDHDLYKEYSKQLMEYISSYCPFIEQVSIDECYMDYTPIEKDYESPIVAANLIKDKVYELFGFTVNIGISDKKVLAKMASDFKKPNLVHTLYQKEIKTKMWPLPISDLLMCGQSSQKTLQNLGISTIGDLAKFDESIIISHLKSHGKLLWEYANGIDNSTIISEREPVKGVGNSITLPKDAEAATDVYPVLLALSQSVAFRMRRHKVLAETITLEIKYHTFQKVSHQASLMQAIDNSQSIYEISKKLFDELWNGTPIRLLGIRATKLVDIDAPVQLNLFQYQSTTNKTEKNQKLDKALDDIRKRFGNQSVIPASLIGQNPKFKN